MLSDMTLASHWTSPNKHSCSQLRHGQCHYSPRQIRRLWLDLKGSSRTAAGQSNTQKTHPDVLLASPGCLTFEILHVVFLPPSSAFKWQAVTWSIRSTYNRWVRRQSGAGFTLWQWSIVLFTQPLLQPLQRSPSSHEHLSIGESSGGTLTHPPSVERVINSPSDGC